ncbi:aldolase/citrate lyase family protein [Hoeflea sp. CAU 1731]
MAPLNTVRRVWTEGRAAVNGWIAVPSVLNIEAMAKARWDALTVDMQHGTADYADLLSILPVIEKSGATPIVRAPWLDEAAIMRALDAGALGIIAPMIETRQDAERFVSACCYPPQGARSFGPVRARLAWGDDYARIANQEVLVFAMIETKTAVANLDAILSVPGLSGIYIGPADLSLSHGFAPGFDREEPEMRALIADIRARSSAAGLRCCLHCGSPLYASKAAAAGMDLVTIGSDARFVEAGALAALDGFKNALEPGS